MAEACAGQDQEHDPQQQQDTPGGAQFFQNGPEKFLHGVEEAARLCLLPRPRPIVALIKPITGPSIAVELGPELVEFESVGHTLPELVELRKGARTLPGGG